MSIIMSNIFPLQKIKGLGPVRIDIAPPTETDKRWGAEITGFVDGVKFYAIFHDDTSSWLQEKIHRYFEGMI